MDIVDQATQLFMQQWGDKTLEELRQESLDDKNGIVFESIRAEGGPRILLLVCVTDPDKLPIFEHGLNLPKRSSHPNWATITIGKVFVKIGPISGLRYEDLRDESGDLTALTLFATDRESIALIEKLFRFPE